LPAVGFADVYPFIRLSHISLSVLLQGGTTGSAR
jgi:hypothetical protein